MNRAAQELLALADITASRFGRRRAGQMNYPAASFVVSNLVDIMCSERLFLLAQSSPRDADGF